ncbi:unnamed protein product [Somion occarium]|uniref:MYND-type domain-containing protein n=2 Tax=Somion occarium TaxID=3059160 RepID=A0ABP1CU34_9APHY
MSGPPKSPPMSVATLNSKRARQTVARCRSLQCLHSKADGTRLFACSGCKIALYCSKECQREDWPSHRRMCGEIQRTASDPRYRQDPPQSLSSPIQQSAPPIINELNDFRKRIFPTLTLVTLNAFSENSPIPLVPYGWEDNIFLLELDRIPNPSQSSPPWTHFRFRNAGIRPIAEVCPEGVDPENDHMRESRLERFDPEGGEGQFGYITISVSCKRGERALTLNSNMRFMRNVTIDTLVEVVDDWKAVLIKQIESITGNGRRR